MASKRVATSAIDDLIVNPTLRLELAYEACVRGLGRTHGAVDVAELTHAAWTTVLRRLDQAALDRLRKLGVLIRADEAPRPVRLRPLRLDQRLPLLPYSDRPGYDRAVPPQRLRVNPTLQIQRGSSPPPLVAGSSVDFLPDPPLAWLQDPGSGIWSALAIDREAARLLRDIDAKRIDPAALSAVEIDLLRRAQLLVPPRYAAERRTLWRRRLDDAAEQLATTELAVVRDVFNPVQLAGLRAYFRELESEGYLVDGDAAVPTRKVLHNEPAARFLHRQLARLVGRITRERIKPSYAYLAVYAPGSVLPRHRDREQCAWNASVVLDAAPETTRANAWPIYIEVAGRPHAVRLEIGDAVIYRGTTLWHWRDAQPPGHKSTVCFFHFVPTTFDKSLD